jgi:hypothetical protein
VRHEIARPSVTPRDNVHVQLRRKAKLLSPVTGKNAEFGLKFVEQNTSSNAHVLMKARLKCILQYLA